MGKRSLQESNGVGNVAELERDNFTAGEFGLLCDGATVWLSQQTKGSPPDQSFEIPKYIFDALLEHYQKPQQARNNRELS
jgi:hypothetical protein